MQISKTILNNFLFTEDAADPDDAMDVIEPAPEDSDRLGNLLNQGDEEDYSGPEEYF